MIAAKSEQADVCEAAVQPLAVDTVGVARLLGISERHVRSLNTTGQLPRPIRLGRRKLWNVRELQEWLDAGSPPRDRWEKIRKAAR